MIVKDEAENLPACLDSIAGLAAEIIVVDTGSTDDTVAIAQAHGARVFHFPWINDFAAARNESIRHATMSWIFILDADDRLDAAALKLLKQTGIRHDADVYTCLIESPILAGIETVQQVRLFRNGLGITYSGSLHESVVPSVERLGLRVAHTAVAIHHAGYAVDAEAMAARHTRNLAIAEAALAARPDDTNLLYARGQSRRGLGDDAGAESDLHRYLSLAPPTPGFDYQRFWAYTTLVTILYTRTDWPALQQILSDALTDFPQHPYFLARLADGQLAHGQPQAALAGMQAAYQAMQAAPALGATLSMWWLELELAGCHRALKEPAEAIRWAERARHHAPEPALPVAMLAQLHLEAGQPAEAEKILVEVLKGGVTIPRPWLVLADVFLAQGRWQEAIGAVQEARRCGLDAALADDYEAQIKAARVVSKTQGSQEGSSPSLTAKIKGLSRLIRGDYLAAAETFADALEAAPADPDLYRYLSTALRKLGRDAEAAEAWQLALFWQPRAKQAR
jgi:tetratricopeptide (TPR) repeat protein